MTRLTGINRHPVKAVGIEALDAVALEAGRLLPWDRVWGVAHEAAEIDEGAWAQCRNFSRGAGAPQLMAVTARSDPAEGTVTLSHKDQPELTVNPDLPEDAARLVAWTDALVPENRARPARVYRADTGLTDRDAEWVSIASHASRRALSEATGVDLDPRRFRANLWLDEGLAPFEEAGWIGREITIGAARLRIAEPIERCASTTANPETGRVDADTLGALERRWGHREFAVLAEVIAGGTIALGDPVAL